MIPISLVVALYLLLSAAIHSQPKSQHFLYNQPPEQPKSIFEIIFNLSELNNSSKIGQNGKTEQSYIARKILQEKDTTQKSNRISGVWLEKDNLNVIVSLTDTEQKINISVYNLLGKKVLEIYDGLPQGTPNDAWLYSKSAAGLPNGVYLCVVLGKSFRLREKFYVSR